MDNLSYDKEHFQYASAEHLQNIVATFMLLDLNI